MKTLLFFDDHFLAVRQNVIRGVGRPALIPESVWHDDERLNTAWGYPSVFFDKADGVWRLLYQANMVKGVRRSGPWMKLVADSEDGLQWKPRDTTRVVKIAGRRFKHQVADGASEWSGLYIDERAEPGERFKRLAVREVWASPDGIRWKQVANWRPDVVDMSAFPFYNKVFNRSFIIGRPSKGDRRMGVFQTDDWRNFTGPILALNADAEDEHLTDTYGMPVFPYEGWFVGFLWLYHGPDQQEEWGAYKFSGGKMDCQLTYSLNGLTWQRAQRDLFISNGGPGSPNAGCVYPSSLVMRPDSNEMWIYASACTWEHGFTPRGTGSILAYRLRKDGFVYLESRSGAGCVATKPLYWQGGELQLNIHGQGGRGLAIANEKYLMNGVRVQVTNSRGVPLKGYTFAECRPYAGDNVAWKPTWESGRKLAALKGKAIQVTVELCNARLYAMRGDFQVMAPQQLRDFEEKGLAPQSRPGF